MFSNPKTLTLTFFFYTVLALSLATVSDATGPDAINLNRRNHISLTRLLKKRAPSPGGLAGLIGVAPDPLSGSSANTPSPTAQASSTSTISSTTSADPVLPLDSVVNSLAGTSTSTSASSSVTSVASSSGTSSVPTSTSASSSTKAAAQTSQSLNVVGVSSSPIANTPDSTQIITQTATGQAASATPSPSPANDAVSASSTKKTTITVLIAIAACIGGVAVIWTIIRKWKFSPSSQFEDRMQPIDWQPTSSPDDGLPQRRLSNASSFHSGSGHIDGTGRGYGATLDVGLPPLPDHDFTPGVSNLAPVGGYADLARGSGPQPQMEQALRRGPSASKPNFGVPIHHQAAFGAQDPYGGVY